MTDETQQIYKEAQKKLIASLLYDGKDAQRILEVVKTDDFNEPIYNVIFDAIATLARDYEDVNIASVSHQLEKTGSLEKAGGMSRLYSLRAEGEDYSVEAPIHVYALIIKEASAKKNGEEIVKKASAFFKYDSGVTASEAITTIQTELNEVLLGLSDESNTVEISEVADDYFKTLEERKAISEENAKYSYGLQGIPSLLPTIDNYTSGWEKGRLITIGARTGIGKSIFACNSALAAIQANKSVQFFTFEMPASEIQDRITSAMSEVPLYALKNGNINENQRKELESAVQTFKESKLLIEAEPNMTIDTIRAKALKRAQSEQGLDMIIIDYLQLIQPSNPSKPRQEQVAEMARQIKLLSKQLNVPVMILVQLLREKQDEENSIPQLKDIRESGAIAQDSDVVILLHREKSAKDEPPKPTSVIIAKNRSGPSEITVYCHSLLKYSLFQEQRKSEDIGEITDESIDELEDELDPDFNDDDLQFDDLDDFDED